MKASFVPSPAMRLRLPPTLPVGHDATAALAALPRPLRKTLHLRTPRAAVVAASALPEAVDSRFNTPYRAAPEFNANLFTQEPGDDEFQDEDNEFEGLTITDSLNEEELWRFCTGYDVL